MTTPRVTEILPAQGSLTAKRVRELADQGAIQALPILSAGYREPSVESPSYPYLPTTEENLTNA